VRGGNMDCGSWILHGEHGLWILDTSRDPDDGRHGRNSDRGTSRSTETSQHYQRPFAFWHSAAATIRRGRAEIEGIEMQEKLMAGEIETVLPLEEELQEEQDR